MTTVVDDVTCLLVDDSPVTTDLHRIVVVALVWLHELDPAVAVPVTVPVWKCRHQQAGGLLACECPAWVVRLLCRLAEQGFGVGVVVGNPRSGEGYEDTQFFLPVCERCGTHGVAVVGMEDQRLLATFTDPLSEVSPAHQFPAMAVSSRSATSQATMRLQTSITR